MRIEDLDRARCKNPLWIEHIKQDLAWFGLDYDNECTQDTYQSNRTSYYEAALARLDALELLYPCYCSRDELHVPNAPHTSDGQPLYPGTCRKYRTQLPLSIQKAPSIRICVPNEVVTFTDAIQGDYAQNLLTDCGDFILRRADGIFSYQLAVVVDDALSGVSEVVRGYDLLSSTPRQIWLYHLLGYSVPTFYHLPLLCTPQGARLSKRDASLDIGALRARFSSPAPILGILSYSLGLTPTADPIDLCDLLRIYTPDKITKCASVCLPRQIFEE